MKKILLSLVLTAITSVLSFGQVKVSGVVKDASGETIPGATFIIKGTSFGAITDNDGKWSTTVPSKTSELEFSCIGYETQTVIPGDRTVIEVVLKESTTFLDESVVVGYGSMSRRDLAGSVASIKSECLENKVLFSVDDALAGGISGLMVSSASGKPGSESNMLIRGVSSLSGSTNPLIVVDGFPLFDVTTSMGGYSSMDTGMSGLALINTDDIASIEVLKDASATAIYGNRGSNGVILITTKKGRQGGGRVQYNSYFGIQEMTKRYELMDIQTYAEYQNLLYKNNDLFWDSMNMKPRQVSDEFPTVDWQDVVYRTGFLQNHSISVSNSTDKTNFLFSGSYMQNQSIVIDTDWKKYTGKISIDHYFSDKIRAGIDYSYSRIDDHGVPTGGAGWESNCGVVLQALLHAPFAFDENTESYFRRMGVKQSDLQDAKIGDYYSPTNLIKCSTLDKVLNRNIVNSYVEVFFTKNLEFKATAGYDAYSLKDRQFYPANTGRGFRVSGEGIISNVEAETWINENTLTWRSNFGKHRINTLIGASLQGYDMMSDTQKTQSYPDGITDYNHANLANVISNSSSNTNYGYLSYMARANYSYDNRFKGTVTLRRDGTSRFIKCKWGTFFSGAVAWNVDEEQWMKNQNVVSQLKLKLSAGQVGNSNVPTSGSYSNLSTNYYAIGQEGAIGQYASSLANESLTWETTTEMNAGIESAFFNDRLSITADVYNKTTNGLLLEAPIMSISGYEKAWQNIGSLSNKGFELSVSGTIINTKNFTWSANANFTKNTTKILKLGSDGAPIYLTIECMNGKSAVIIQEGESVGQMYGYITDGIYTVDDFQADGVTLKEGVVFETGSEAIGWMKFKDMNDDDKITADDRRVIGNSLPDFYGAFGTDFRWKNWDLSVNFQYSYGNDVYNANLNMLSRYYLGDRNQLQEWKDRYTATNQNSTVHSGMTSMQPCTAFVEDGSYLRLKNLRLTYTLPRLEALNRAHVSGLKAYVAADNLFVLTKYSGYDPEVFSKQNSSTSTTGILTSGFDYGCFPRPKTFTVGFNFTFE